MDEEEKSEFGERIVTKAIVKQTVEGVSAEEIGPDRVESRSVFVKNSNFKTTDELLKQHFSTKLNSGTVKSAKVKNHVKKGKTVSMGFGFVEFDYVETATSVCKDLQGTGLDGHALILQLCHGKKDGQAARKNDKDKFHKYSCVYLSCLAQNRIAGRWPDRAWHPCLNVESSQANSLCVICTALAGAYDNEETAVRAYDLAALKYWGPGIRLNFPLGSSPTITLWQKDQ